MRKKSWTLKIRTILTDGLSRTGNSGTRAAFTHTYGILYVPCRKEHIHPKRLPNLTLRSTLQDRLLVKLQCFVCRRPIIGWSLPLRRPLLRSLLYMAIYGAGCVSQSVIAENVSVLAPGSCALYPQHIIAPQAWFLSIMPSSATPSASSSAKSTVQISGSLKVFTFLSVSATLR
jgi:hypothetical protein